ncbi:MAG: Holliday junction branch migration DNA helicase RuvB [Candidatus Colwellbacteria bacterium]|nr:Holliday junction branch migration DNA helicase RuvB [Candidatus Colwellbacteria bacterium]
MLSRGENNGHIQGQNDDQNWESLLRPSGFDDYIGQDSMKKSLRIILDAANQRGESIDHLLFYGQAGLGKTTIAHIVAKEMGGNLKVTSGPAIEKTGDLAAILTNLESGDILFIDEIHRLNRMIEEVLYPAMESRSLNIILGKGPSARTISLDLPPFTLIAATTRVNLISGPLRSRFGATFRLDYYTIADISEIIRRSARILGVDIETGAIDMLSHASRFTPRTANRLLKRARDLAQVSGIPAINTSSLGDLFNILEIDKAGLEYQDRRLLRILSDHFAGGPAGINSLSAALGEEKGVIEDVYEPFLMKMGLIKRTSSGRMLTPEAVDYLNAEDKNK